MKKYSYLNTQTRRQESSLSAIFPGWSGAQERLMVYSPHDDDAILGAGYAMRAAMDDGAQVFICIVCSGNAGYSSPDERDSIVETRRAETLACYESFGVPRENICFLGYSDFSALQYVGWNIAPGREGHFRRTISELRDRQVTRALAPNHYREHIDHLAASMMAAYDAPQSGDAFAVDWAPPHPVRSVAQYAVWADLDPEDALVNGRSAELRANVILAAGAEVEECVRDSIRAYASQGQIISDLLRQREERRLPDGRFIELYLRFDPRPKLNYEPYKQLFGEIADKE